VTNAVKKKYIDLHLHSTYSDGTLSIKEIVEYASTQHLAAISLTDHDCIAGIREITELAGKVGLEVVPGVEISSLVETSDIHVLGYFIDYSNTELNERLEEIRLIRIERAKKIVQRLNDKGVVLRFERVLEFARGYCIGRPHIAQALVAEEHVNSFTEAFDRYLGNHTEFYIPVQKLNPAEAIALIKCAGGVSVLSHPHVTDRNDLLEQFIKDGLDGIEVYSPKMTYRQFNFYRQFCHKYNLLETGGSDCHGPRFNDTMSIGSTKTPYRFLERMQARIQQHNGASF